MALLAQPSTVRQNAYCSRAVDAQRCLRAACSNICLCVPPLLLRRTPFRRDLQTKSHPAIHPHVHSHRSTASASVPAPHSFLLTCRSCPAVLERAHVPVYAVPPLFAHRRIPTQCPPPQHHNYRHEGRSRTQGLVRLSAAIAIAGKKRCVARTRGAHAVARGRTWQGGRLRTTSPLLV